MPVTVYHNPRCSKSRATLALLEARGITANVVLYLDTPPDRARLEALLGMLGLGPRGLLRQGEPLYRELGLGDPSLDDEYLLQALLDHPLLMERPIVVHRGRAIIGRPPEKVLEIL